MPDQEMWYYAPAGKQAGPFELIIGILATVVLAIGTLIHS
jgi:hypothetical protein